MGRREARRVSGHDDVVDHDVVVDRAQERVAHSAPRSPVPSAEGAVPVPVPVPDRPAQTDDLRVGLRLLSLWR